MVKHKSSFDRQLEPKQEQLEQVVAAAFAAEHIEAIAFAAVAFVVRRIEATAFAAIAFAAVAFAAVAFAAIGLLGPAVIRRD